MVNKYNLRSATFWFAFYIFTIFAANWAINKWGIVPIGFGLSAPAGVYFVGIAFTARDGLRETTNRWLPLLAILVGAFVSYFIEDGHRIALASGIAFGLSESADALVYEPLRQRGKTLAVLVSNCVGLVLDSILFLSIAFGSLEFLTGQIVGKLYMTIIAVLILFVWSRRESILSRFH